MNATTPSPPAGNFTALAVPSIAASAVATNSSPTNPGLPPVRTSDGAGIGISLGFAIAITAMALWHLLDRHRARRGWQQAHGGDSVLPKTERERAEETESEREADRGEDWDWGSSPAGSAVAFARVPAERTRGREREVDVEAADDSDEWAARDRSPGGGSAWESFRGSSQAGYYRGVLSVEDLRMPRSSST